MNELKETLNKKATNYIAKYNKAMQNATKSAWTLAEVVYTTVKAPDFKDAFGELQNYATAIGVSKSSITKLVKAVERRKALEDVNDTEPFKFSLGQLEEMNTIEVGSVKAFVEYEAVEDTDTTKEIREKAKHFIKVLNGEETEGTEETETEETETEENGTTITLYFDAILALLNDKKSGRETFLKLIAEIRDANAVVVE